MEMDGSENIEVSLKTEALGATEDGVHGNTDAAIAFETNASVKCLRTKSLRNNKPTGHDSGISSQQLWVHELESDDSSESPSFLDSSTSSKLEEANEMDNKTTASSSSFSKFLENHAHLLPLPLQKAQRSARTIKACGSKNATGPDDSTFSSFGLLDFQQTLRSGAGRVGSVLNIFGYESDEDDDDLDKILGPLQRTKQPQQSKTLSAWNANIAAAIAEGKSRRIVPTLTSTPEETATASADTSLKEFSKIPATFYEIDEMDYSTASWSGSGPSQVDNERDMVYERGDSADQLDEKYRKRRILRCFRMTLILALIAAIVIAAPVLIAIHFFNEAEDTDTIAAVLPELPSHQPTVSQSHSPSMNTRNPSVAPSETFSPTFLPTLRPSRQPTETPTTKPSIYPSAAPSETTSLPSVGSSFVPTIEPTRRPSRQPTEDPSATPSGATPLPSVTPTSQVTANPSKLPTPKPSHGRTSTPTEKPSFNVNDLVATFYVLSDLPHNDEERDRLIYHVNNLPSDAEFLVHLGDIRDAGSQQDCKRSEFNDVANILRQSPVPVFIVPGDNEYNECPNLDESWADYLAEFGNFQRNWNTRLTVNRNPVSKENFFFVYKRVMYIGLNVVGGWGNNYDEWEMRLDQAWLWTRDLIDTYVNGVLPIASSIVIFAHADPSPTTHAPFFEPLTDYIRNELKNEVPILYINGDKHFWQLDTNFYGEPSFHRIMVEGGSKEPAFKVTIAMPSNPNHDALNVNEVYTFDRRL